MAEEKVKIYLTDITLHTQKHRKTVNFAKVAQKGRIYSLIPTKGLKTSPTNRSYFSMAIEFPKDLQNMIDRDEVELMMPEEGLLIYAGEDTEKFLKSPNGKRLIRGLAKGKKGD